jgi:hypothetical protein
MRQIPPNQMQMQPYFVVDPSQPVSVSMEDWAAYRDPTDYAGAQRRARRAMALVVVGLMAICGGMATAAHTPQVTAFAKHAIRIG